MSTEERLAALERRVESIEKVVQFAQVKIDTMLQSPGAKKLSSLLGVRFE